MTEREKSAIRLYIMNCSADEFVEIHNVVSKFHNYEIPLIYTHENINDLFNPSKQLCTTTLVEFAQKIADGDFDSAWKYWVFDDHENIVSVKDVSQLQRDKTLHDALHCGVPLQVFFQKLEENDDYVGGSIV